MLKTKYLWLAALVALCAVLCVGSAYAQGDHWVVAVEPELDDDGEPVLDDDDNPVMLEVLDFPSAMMWDESAGVSFGALNDGSTTWNTDYDFRSVEGTTETALSLVDRWGLTFTPADGITPPVAPDETYDCAFSISAPPITTLAYVLPVGPTSPPSWLSYVGDPLDAEDNDVSAFLECDWTLANLGVLVTDSGLAESEIAITRYPDDAPDSLGGWAGVFIEECAGRVPFIVQGYPDGLYRPRGVLTRDAMAVFMRRAMKIPQIFPDPAEWDEDEEEWITYNTFPDVPSNDGSDPPDVHWAVGDVEALVDAGVVAGYPDELYHPEFTISRAQMAVFVARAADYTLQRDDDGASTLLYDPFPDVASDFWAAPEIWACARNGVVLGYTDGFYRPTVTVSRDQMAVYSYRAFIQSTACAVVLAGPAVGNLDPTVASWTGVSTNPSDPTVAWVGFDAMRLGPELAYGGAWTIKFEYCEGTGTTVAATNIAQVTPAQIATAKADAESTGVAYFYVSTAVPGLASGPYTLRVSVEDVDGTMFELPRTVELSSSQMPPPPGCPRVPDADSATEWMAATMVTDPPDGWGDGNRAVAGGSILSAMAESDDTYYVSSLTAYPMGSDEDCCDNYGESFVWHDVEDTATALRIELEYHVVDQEAVDPFSCCLGVNPCIDWQTTAPFQPEMGWGLGVMNVADPWDLTTWGSESDLYKDTDYTDPLLPDFEFVKMALDTDETVVWETTNVSDYRSAEGDVVLHFCGGAYQSLYVDKLVLTTALPPTPRVPDADDPEPWMTATTELPDDPDGWGDASRMPRTGAVMAQMAASDMVYYYADLTLYPVDDDSTYCCLGFGDTFIWNDIPTDALDLTLMVRYHIELGTDFTCCGDNPCDAWGGTDPEPGATEPPYGWGLMMVDWADPWGDWGDDGDVQAADSPFGQFYGHPTTDRTHTWTSANVGLYVDPDPLDPAVGDVAIHFCGQGGYTIAIDEMTLVFTPGPASPPVWPVCP